MRAVATGMNGLSPPEFRMLTGLTLETYAHVLPVTKKDGADQMNAILAGASS